jgi:effector-binding domain-containing protein
MIPLAAKPQGKPALPAGVELGTSPAGKAIKFQHRGPYDEIESTYNLITAFLDEKGLEAQDLFIEEYLTDTKESDDVGLEADIYVFLK